MKRTIARRVIASSSGGYVKGHAYGQDKAERAVLATLAYPLSLLGWIAGFLYRKFR